MSPCASSGPETLHTRRAAAPLARARSDLSARDVCTTRAVQYSRRRRRRSSAPNGSYRRERPGPLGEGLARWARAEPDPEGRDARGSCVVRVLRLRLRGDADGCLGARFLVSNMTMPVLYKCTRRCHDLGYLHDRTHILPSSRPLKRKCIGSSPSTEVHRRHTHSQMTRCAVRLAETEHARRAHACAMCRYSMHLSVDTPSSRVGPGPALTQRRGAWHQRPPASASARGRLQRRSPPRFRRCGPCPAGRRRC